MTKQKKILVVDDEDSFRNVLKKLLSQRFEIDEAINGQEARNLIKLQKYDLIISDDQMPFLTGIELLEWVKKNHPTKFILMIQSVKLLDKTLFPELNPDNILIKPFTDSDLFSAIDALLLDDQADQSTNDNQNKSLDHEYCRVPIADFVNEREYKYDIFIKINDFKYIKVAHQGGKVDQDRIKAFHEKKVFYFYIHKKDFIKLVNFTVNFSKVVQNSTFIENEKKIRFLHYTGEIVLQNLFLNGLDISSLNYAKNFTQLSIEAICEQNEIFSLISSFSEHVDHLYAHSLAVAVLSVMIAQAMGWTRHSVLFKVAMSGMLHDIGLKEISHEILCKPRAQLTQKEITIFETHPLRGKEILESLRVIPSDVISVAFEHHENIIARGYPRGINKVQIHPITHIVTTANVFSKLTVKNPNCPNPMSPIEAIKYMELSSLELVDEQCFEALKSLILSTQ